MEEKEKGEQGEKEKERKEEFLREWSLSIILNVGGEGGEKKGREERRGGNREGGEKIKGEERRDK